MKRDTISQGDSFKRICHYFMEKSLYHVKGQVINSFSKGKNHYFTKGSIVDSFWNRSGSSLQEERSCSIVKEQRIIHMWTRIIILIEGEDVACKEGSLHCIITYLLGIICYLLHNCCYCVSPNIIIIFIVLHNHH